MRHAALSSSINFLYFASPRPLTVYPDLGLSTPSASFFFRNTRQSRKEDISPPPLPFFFAKLLLVMVSPPLSFVFF